MKTKSIPEIVILLVSLSVVLSTARAAQYKYTVKMLNGSRFPSSEDMKHGRMSQ